MAAKSSKPWLNEESLTPITSKLCNWCTLVCLIMAIWAYFFLEIDDRRPRITKEDDEWLIWCQQFAACMAFTGLLFETALAVAIEVLGMRSVCFGKSSFSNRVRLNRKMLYLFTMLFTVYQCMAFDVQYVHKGWIAAYHGGHQVVYSIRYFEWMVCAPMVVSVVGDLEPGPDGKPRNGLHTSGICTGIYCIISWQGLVVKNFWAAWALIAWSFISFFVSSYEQLVFAWHIRKKGRAGPIRCAMVLYLVVTITLYGIIYLLPIQGWITATLEQKFYCFADAFFKVGGLFLLFATRVLEDMASNAELQAKVTTQAEDLGRLVETAAVPIFGVDNDRRINQWNEKMADLTGLAKAQALGAPFLEMVQGPCLVQARDMLDEALAGKLPRPIEIAVCPSACPSLLEDEASSKTKKLWSPTLVLSGSATRDKSGTVVGATCMGYDLTEIAAIREAEVRKSRFLAVVSHELRSPLHGIIGLSDSLASQQKDPTHTKKLRMVKNCATRLLDLVVNIMEMASMVSKDASDKDHAPKRLHRDPVELPKILEELITLINNACDKSGRPLLKDEVKLINNLPQEMPIIEADAHKCTQVFENLLTNACKFTKKGAIIVSGQVGPRKEYVEVSVSDTGKGVSEEARQRIFEPFEQEEATEMRQYEGIGLGLPIANEVVRRHGGKITLESRLGAGSTFTVRFPVVMNEVLTPLVGPISPWDNEKTKPLSKRAAGEGPKAKKVALMEPSETLDAPVGDVKQEAPETKMEKKPQRKPVVLAVGSNGALGRQVLEAGDSYEWHSAADADQVREYFAKQLPDLLLVDSSAGGDVCDVVHQQMRRSCIALPVVMLAAGGAKASGREDLKARVESVLDLKRLADTSAPHPEETPRRRRQRSQTHPPGTLQAALKGMKATDSAERHTQVSVLRCDVVGWADIMQSLPASKALNLLEELFQNFDELSRNRGARRLESSSGTYMCSLSRGDAEDHASRITKLGLELLEATVKAKEAATWPGSASQGLQLRVGAHMGPAFEGAMGGEEPKQVLFGDAVSVASCLQERCSPGCLHLSTWIFQELSSADRLALVDSGTRIMEVGPFELPGRGQVRTHLVAPRGVSPRFCGITGTEGVADVATRQLKEELRREQVLREELEAKAQAAQRSLELRDAELAELQEKAAEMEKAAAQAREELKVREEEKAAKTEEAADPYEPAMQARKPHIAMLPMSKVQHGVDSPPSIREDSAEETGSDVAEAQVSVPAPANQQAKERDGALTKKHLPIILSVDDDIVNQTVIESALSEQYDIHVAMDGTEALEYFDTHSRLPDVMLLDVMMPGMSGFEVCNSIRNQLRLSVTALPIVMLSARSPVEQSVITGLGNGCNDYISKPFEKEVLKARVHTALQIKRLHESELKQSRYEQLLHSIMPPHVIDRLQAGENMIAESHSLVTILFSDIVGWTNIAEMLSTSQVVILLNDLFSAFDNLTEKHGVFKVETIGDAYMCAAGHDGSQDHAQKIARFGLAMIEAAGRVKPPVTGLRLQIRVGAHTGPAYTGVVGRKVPRYCFFGDTVNVSSRMESNGSPGLLHISDAMHKELMKDPSFQDHTKARIVERGTVEIKGKGPMLTHLILPEGAAVPSSIAKSSRSNRRLASAPAAALRPAVEREGDVSPGDESPGSDAPSASGFGFGFGATSPTDQQLEKQLKAVQALAASQEEAKQRAEDEARAEAQACKEAQRDLEKQAVRLAAMESELAAGRRLALEMEDQLREAERHSQEQASALKSQDFSVLDQQAIEAERVHRSVLEREKLELQEKLLAVEAERSAAQIAQAELQVRVRELEQARQRQSAEQPRAGALPSLEGLGGHRASWSMELGAAGTGGLSLASGTPASSAAEPGLPLPLHGLEKQVKHLALEVKIKEKRLQECRNELEALRSEMRAKHRDAEAVEDKLQHALLDLGQ